MVNPKVVAYVQDQLERALGQMYLLEFYEGIGYLPDQKGPGRAGDIREELK